MTAGTGISHSELNPSPTDPVHLLQIWLIPDRRGHTPGYQQKLFPDAAGQLVLVASPDGDAGSLTIHQNARLYRTRLTDSAAVQHTLAQGRAAFVHLALGTATVNGTPLSAGDAVAVEAEPDLTLSGSGELLLIDLA
jgi:redox-sensitive bicupin YhaK (pirin superfamily)